MSRLEPSLLPRSPDAPRDPAMAAGLTDHVWELADLIALMPKPVA
jgi:hypothetical protein